MPRRDKDIDNSKITSDNVEQLELIKIDVEQVNKKIKDISTFAQKQISVLQREFDRSMKAMNQINDKTTDSYKQQVKYVNQISNEMQNIVSAEREANRERDKERKEAARNVANKDVEKVNKEIEYNKQIRESGGDITRIIQLGFNRGQEKRRDTLQSNLEDALKAFTESDQGPEAQKNWQNALKDFTKGTEDIDKSASNFKVGSTLFNAGIDILKSFLTLWLQRFETGINKIASTYEELYQKQAVLADINESQYQNAQKAMVENIREMGLQDNLAITEVMTATSEYINRGITDFGKAQELGQQRAIANVLAPYLETASDAYISLSQTLGPSFSKSMIGMGNYVSEVVGQNRFTQKNLNTLIDLTEPVSLAAKKSLLGEEGIAMIESLVDKGMDMQSATQFATDVASAVANPLEGLESGHTGIAAAIASGERDFTGIAASALQTQADLQRYTDKDLGSAAFLQAFGGYGAYNLDFSEMVDETISELQSGKFSRTGTFDQNGEDDSQQTYQEMIKKFQQGQYTTAQQEKDIMAENLSVNLAIYKERWPDLFKAIEGVGKTIVNAIALWVGGKVLGGVIGKGIGALAGSGLGGSGAGLIGSLGSLLGPAGAVALGVGAVAGTVAIINSKIANEHRDKVDQTTNRLTNMYEQNKEAGMDDATNISNIWDTGQVSDNNGIFQNAGETEASFTTRKKLLNGQYSTVQSSFENFVNNEDVSFSSSSGAGGSMLEAYSYQDKKFRESMGLTPKALESGYTEATKALEKYGWGGERNAPAYNKIKTYALAAFLNQNQDIPFKYAMAALSAALILGKHTNDDSIMSSMSEYFGSAIITDKNTLTQTLEKSGITEAKYLSSIYRILGDKNIDYWLMTNTGGIMTYPSEEELKSNFNLHKTGLDFVPYDEYPALLHEGEAVLTKDAASYLRTATPEDISQLGGVQDALDNTTQVTSVSDYTPIVTVLQESDRSNKESLNLVASAINNQTNVMVSKLDKIITVISSNKGSSTYSNNFVNLESGGF